jgi:membrane protein DedA with SNARE-associated domain
MPGLPPGPTLVVIFAAAAIEGEVVYLAACSLVAAGALSPWPVLVAGMLGAATGDQAYFYLVRFFRAAAPGRVARLVARASAVLERVAPHATAVAFLLRFLPGVRVAAGVACALCPIRAVVFSVMNLAGAALWATTLMLLTAWLGPTWSSVLGLPSWAMGLVVGGTAIVTVHVIARIAIRRAGVRPANLET